MKSQLLQKLFDYFRPRVKNYRNDPRGRYLMIQPDNNVPIIMVKGTSKVKIELTSKGELKISSLNTNESHVSNGTKKKWAKIEGTYWIINRHLRIYRVNYDYNWQLEQPLP